MKLVKLSFIKSTPTLIAFVLLMLPCGVLAQELSSEPPCFSSEEAREAASTYVEEATAAVLDDFDVVTSKEDDGFRADIVFEKKVIKELRAGSCAALLDASGRVMAWLAEKQEEQAKETTPLYLRVEAPTPQDKDTKASSLRWSIFLGTGVDGFRFPEANGFVDAGVGVDISPSWRFSLSVSFVPALSQHQVGQSEVGVRFWATDVSLGSCYVLGLDDVHWALDLCATSRVSWIRASPENAANGRSLDSLSLGVGPKLGLRYLLGELSFGVEMVGLFELIQPSFSFDDAGLVHQQPLFNLRSMLFVAYSFR